MMQAVSQSYSSLTYTQVQKGSTSPANRIEASKTADPLSPQSTPRSTTDTITLSPEGIQLSQRNSSVPGSDEKHNQVTANNTKGQGQEKLSQEELRAITTLQRRDSEVRSHEQAHLSAAGQYAAGGASFSYTTGPNGKRYANGGEVPIDIAKEKTPEATILKMRTVRRAALAPANPSSVDRSIAAQASAKEAQAMKEIQDQAMATTSANTISSEENITEGTFVNQRSDTPETTPSQVSGSEAPQASDYSRSSFTSANQAVTAPAS